jgi:putative hydrolase of the HAD superfamily
MIKAVVFDYGGVITSGGGGSELAERLATFLQIPFEQATALVFAPWPKFVKGEIDEAGYWEVVEHLYGQPIPLKSRAIWNIWDHMYPRPEMIAFVHQLKKDGYTVGLLSNVIPVTEQVIREHGVYDEFQPCILSCDVGLAKPDLLIYEALLQQLPHIKPEEIIFVDDQQRCLDPAEHLGMRTVKAINARQIIDDVNALLQK